MAASSADTYEVLQSSATPVAPAAAPATSEGRLFELDLLRFVAAVAVVVFHLGFIGSTATGPQPSNLLAPVAKYGYLGVDFFFILSGYVITRSAKQRGALSFVRARLVRLLPSYLAAIAATSTVLTLVGEAPSLRRILANATFTQRIFSQPFIDGAYWSLLVELKFYAIIATLIAVGAINQLEWFAYAWLAGVVVLRFSEGPDWLNSIVITPYAPLFVAGIIFSLFSEGRAEGQPVDRWASRTRVGFLTLCMALALSQATADAEELTNATRQYSPLVAAVATVAFFALFTVIAVRGLPFLRRPAFAALGAASYPLYLLHQEIGFRVFDAWNGPFWFMFATVLLGVTLASHFVSTRIEAPFSAWLKDRQRS